MSILIKGLEMPKNCLECVFYRRTDPVYDYCCISSTTPKEYVPNDCPLVEIPPHGRLIDADALEVKDGWLRDSKYFAQESSHTHITFVYSNDIYNAPTVIPADKDGEE